MIAIGPLTPLEDINEKIIEELITVQVPEGPFVEYKRVDKDKRQSARPVRESVASFANSEGGFVFCGIADLQDREVKNASDLTDRIPGLPSYIREFGKWVDDIIGKDHLIVPAIRYKTNVIRITPIKRLIGVIQVATSDIGPAGVRWFLSTSPMGMS